MDVQAFSNDSTVEQFESFSQRTLTQLIQHETEEEGWIKELPEKDAMAHVPELKFCSKFLSEECGVKAVRVSGVVNAEPKRLFRSLCAMGDGGTRKTLESNLLEHTVLKEVTPEIKLLRRRYSAPFPLHPREFIVVNVHKQVGDSYLLFSTSVSHFEYPETEDYVRGDMKVSGTILRPFAGNKTKMTKIVQIDPKGNIPSALVNFVVHDQPSLLVALNKVVF